MILVLLGLATGFKLGISFVNVTETEAKVPVDVAVGNQSALLPEFDNATQPTHCCLKPELFIFYQTSNLRKFDPFYTFKATQLTGPVNLTDVDFPQTKAICSPGSSCEIKVTNNCTQEITFGQKHILVAFVSDNKPQQYSVAYNYVCNSEQKLSKFEYGTEVLIAFSWVLLFFSASFSKTYAFRKISLDVNLFAAFLFLVVLAGVGMLGMLLQPVLKVLATAAVSYLGGGLAVFLCTAQLLFFFPNEALRGPVLGRIRVLDILSLLVAVGMVIGFLASNFYWVVNNVISVCLGVSLIKLLRLKSLRVGAVLLAGSLLIQIGVALYIHYEKQTSYDDQILKLYYSPALLVFPSITRRLEVACSWLPMTTISMCGLVLAYLKRLDVSRSTCLYTTVGQASYLVGSTSWLLMTTYNKHSWPYSIFTFPTLLLLTTLFAYRRNELRPLISGEFLEEESQVFEEPERDRQFRISLLIPKFIE